MGLLHILRAMGKRPQVVNDGRIPTVFHFLPGADGAGTRAEDMRADCDLVIVVDTASRERLGSVGERLPADVPTLGVDHHADNERFLRINWVDPGASAVGEMVLRLAEESGWPVPPEAATCLYAALITDTDRFTLPNTTPAALRAGARLIELGAAHREVCERVYRCVPLHIAHLKGLTLQSIRLVLGGAVAVGRVGREMLRRTGADALDTQEFSELPRSIEGVLVGVLLREMEDGRVKVSLRGRPGYDVRQVARHLDGGGHPEAAGCIVSGDLEAAEARVLAALAEALKREAHAGGTQRT